MVMEKVLVVNSCQKMLSDHLELLKNNRAQRSQVLTHIVSREVVSLSLVLQNSANQCLEEQDLLVTATLT